MNLADYIVLLLVATAVCFALHLLRNRKKNGSSCCGGGTGNSCSGCCGSCGMCGSGGKKPADAATGVPDSCRCETGRFRPEADAPDSAETAKKM